MKPHLTKLLTLDVRRPRAEHGVPSTIMSRDFYRAILRDALKLYDKKYGWDAADLESIDRIRKMAQ